MKRLGTVEPVWVTWQEEPGKLPIKVGEMISVDNGDGTATVRRFDEYVTVEIELLRPRRVAA